VSQLALREIRKKKKQLKDIDLRSSPFLPLFRAKAFRHSLLFIKTLYASQDI
jgi:hypothetical protein